MHEQRSAALVDLDDTLLEYRVEENAAQAALADAIGVGASPAWSSAYRWAKDAERRLAPDGVDRLERRIKLFASALAIGLSSGDVRRLRRVYVDARLGAVSTLPGARELLAHVRSTFDFVLICTMGVHDLQVARIRAAGLESGLDDVLVSDLRGTGKEDWPAFLGCWYRPSWSYAVISDNGTPDLESARATRMFTVGLGGNAESACHLWADNLGTLIRMVKHSSLVNRMERHYQREIDT